MADRHTPGPWRLDGSAHVMGTDKRSCGEMPVAVVFAFAGTAARDANAALIAAAPAMREALRLALPILDGMNHLDGAEERERAAAVAAIRAALGEG